VGANLYEKTVPEKYLSTAQGLYKNVTTIEKHKQTFSLSTKQKRS